MMSMFVFGVIGGLVAAFFAFPYGWLAAILAYALGGAVFALLPGIYQWRQELARERARLAGICCGSCPVSNDVREPSHND
jgi:hypothetical protein